MRTAWLYNRSEGRHKLRPSGALQREAPVPAVRKSARECPTAFYHIDLSRYSVSPISRESLGSGFVYSHARGIRSPARASIDLRKTSTKLDADFRYARTAKNESQLAEELPALGPAHLVRPLRTA